MALEHSHFLGQRGHGASGPADRRRSKGLTDPNQTSERRRRNCDRWKCSITDANNSSWSITPLELREGESEGCQTLSSPRRDTMLLEFANAIWSEETSTESKNGCGVVSNINSSALKVSKYSRKSFPQYLIPFATVQITVSIYFRPFWLRERWARLPRHSHHLTLMGGGARNRKQARCLASRIPQGRERCRVIYTHFLLRYVSRTRNFLPINAKLSANVSTKSYVVLPLVMTHVRDDAIAW